VTLSPKQGVTLSINEDVTLVIIPFKAKGFAFLLDFAFQEIGLATLVDASRLQSPRPITRQRRIFQKSVAAKKNFLEVRLGSLRSLLLALISLPIDYHKFCAGMQIHEKKSDTGLTDILLCRLAAFMGDRDFNLADTPFFEFSRHYLVSKRASIDFHHFLSKVGSRFSRIVVFNGREPLEATFIKIAKEYGLKVLIVEKGSNNSKYQVFEHSPHYHPNWWQIIEDFSDSALNITDSDSTTSRIDYTSSKLKGIDPYFGDLWNKETPRDFPVDEFVDGTTVLYFTSSSTEFSPFDEYNYNVGYTNQYEAVKDLAIEVLKLGLKLAIRRHPNSVGLDGVDRENQKWISTISGFDTNKVKYFEPAQKFNNLSSIISSRAVFVWKSSIGFESLALGKPTFALATAKWSWDAALRCWNREEIQVALKSELNLSLAARVVDQYANFMANSGTPCTLVYSAHKWGFVNGDKQVIHNGIFEKQVQYLRSLAPSLFGLRRRLSL